MLRIRHPNDFMFGATLAAVSALFWWLSSDLRFGTAMRMGPGYMPTVLSWVGIALGAVLVLRSTAIDGPPLERWSLRPMLLVSLAVGAFMAVESIGLVVAVAAVTLIASAGERGTRWGEAAVSAAVLSVASALVFVVGLGLPMPLWPQF